MKITIKIRDKSKWHKWFAWRPVFFCEEHKICLAWLVPVERRLYEPTGERDSVCSYYQYRELSAQGL